MASDHPPFQVEDNTDEDFFDKLVDDDHDANSKVMETSATSVAPFLSDENESDVAKALTNLIISDLDDGGGANYGKACSSNHDRFDDVNTKIEKFGQTIKSETEGVEVSENPLALPNSFEFSDSKVVEPESENGGAEVASDRTMVSKSSDGDLSNASVISKSSVGSGAPGVKEVGWSAFNADSAQNDSNGFGSYSDFFSELGGDVSGDAFGNAQVDDLKNGPHVAVGNELHASTYAENSNNIGLYNEGFNYDAASDQTVNAQDWSSWENQYPGWKYDPSTGQWYQIDGYDGSANADSNLSSTWRIADRQAEVSYLQQTTQFVAGTVAETGKLESVTNWSQASQVRDATETTKNWNQASQVSSETMGVLSDWNQASLDNNGFPSHMVIDPQYPGWYYDTISQEWHTLESAQSIAQVQDSMNQDGYASTGTVSQNIDQNTCNTHYQGTSYNVQGFGSQGQYQTRDGSVSKYNQQNSGMWPPENIANSGATLQFTGNQLMEDHHGQNVPVSAQRSQLNTAHSGVTGSYDDNASQSWNNFSMPSSTQGFDGGNSSPQFSGFGMTQNVPKHVSNGYYTNQNSVNFLQQQIQSGQMSYAPAAGRSSAGRPAHALVAFGFGGKLIVLNDKSSAGNLNFSSQNPLGGAISVLNLAEVVTHNGDASNHRMGFCSYFQALYQQSIPGPLTGGGVGTKELNKWIDDRIANPESADMDYRRAEVLALLFSLLKIACQYYGKLRSHYGTDAVLKENDAPESAVAKLFASAKRKGSQFSQYGAVAQILQQMPSEGQMRVTAAEVQNLLVSGRTLEALQCAQKGQLWGPAIVLAAQLGDQFYIETVKQMALHQFIAGSPLRTLCLLIAGQPADVFSADSTTIGSMAGALNMPQHPVQFGGNSMLDDWEENLAVIAANRTKDDELVLIHLGDCLWKDRSNIIAAHICYLVAETSFEPYSETARLCLVGADHWKFPRTYASPQAIQRTEIYEYSKTIGNSQFVLLPFQPYKLIYAHMLAEVGRISDALKYCQAVLKSLKTGRTPTPEVESLRNLTLSLEERIKVHQQGGFSTNLAPKKLVGKLLDLFDSTAQRVVGGLPPPVPTAGGTAQGKENHHQSLGSRVSTSQSTMAMSSLVPSESLEPISGLVADSSRKPMHTRSVSEPDFGRSPRQGKSSAAVGTSRFGPFGFGSQLLQKTVGLVLKPRQGRQAKLGDTNKFYYDEKLKRWVEEGAEPPAEEGALPPPPPTAVFQNGTPDYSLKNALQNESSHSNGSPEFKSPSFVDNNSGIPPLPPNSNQYSAYGRMGVRSRYVDTFNQGGGNARNSFVSPSAPVKPASGANPKFFVPAPVTAVEHHQGDASVNDIQDSSPTRENPSTSPLNDSFQSPSPSSSMTMQRFPSMDNISNQRMIQKGSLSVQSRRTASWSGTFNDSLGKAEVRPLGEVLGVHPSSFMPSDPSLVHSSIKGGSFGDDLHEVEL